MASAPCTPPCTPRHLFFLVSPTLSISRCRVGCRGLTRRCVGIIPLHRGQCKTRNIYIILKRTVVWGWARRSPVSLVIFATEKEARLHKGLLGASLEISLAASLGISLTASSGASDGDSSRFYRKLPLKI